MFSRVILQKLAPLPMRAIAAFNSSSSHASIRQASTQNALRDSNSVLVEAYYRQPLMPNESATLAQLAANRQLLVKEAPDLADKIARGIRNQHGKHDIGGKIKITNNFAHFEDAEIRWSKMETKIQKLENFQQEMLRKDALMNKAELYKAICTIQDVLRSRYWTEQDHRSEALTSSHKAQAQADTPEADQVEADVRSIRNWLAHPVDLKPCLLVVDEEPTFELVFDALFGLSSVEAKALYRFDKTQNFHVNSILSEHARLWKSGLADTFVGSYHRWLEAMRLLLSQQSLSKIDPALVSSVERLAKEARDKAAADFAAADAQDLSNPQKMKKRLRRKESEDGTDPYHWDKIISDWKDRGLWQKFVAEWKLLPVQGSKCGTGDTGIQKRA